MDDNTLRQLQPRPGQTLRDYCVEITGQDLPLMQLVALARQMLARGEVPAEPPGGAVPDPDVGVLWSGPPQYFGTGEHGGGVPPEGGKRQSVSRRYARRYSKHKGRR